MVTRTKKKPNTDEIATYQNDITQYYIGKVLINPDTVLSSEAAGQGLKVYAELDRDDRVYSEMQKRKLAVIGKEWSVEPASEDAPDVKIAEFVENNFKEMKLDRACEELLDGILMGFKPCEIMWDYSEGDIWIKEYRGRDPRRFTFDLENQLRLLTYKNMIEGEEVPDRKFQLFRFGEKNNNPFGTGLGNKLYWPVWFKKNGVKFWAVFLEKFGQPTPWGKYPPGTEKDKQNDLLAALKAMQTDQAIITPDTMLVELLEAARTSSVDSYEKWGYFWNEAITLVILGQTATTTGTPGKLGAETERSEVRQEYVKADADRLSEWLNDQSIKWLVDYNFPNVKKYPKFWKQCDPPEDLEKLSKVHQVIFPMLDDVPKKFIHDTYSIPTPEGKEKVISFPRGILPVGFSQGDATKTELAAMWREYNVPGTVPNYRRSRVSGRLGTVPISDAHFAETDWVQVYMDRLAPSLKNVKASALDEISAWLTSQGSPPSEEVFISKIQDLLGDSYKNIDKTAVSDAVTEIYQNFKMTVVIQGLSPELLSTIGFGGADIRAIDFLGKLDHFYLSKFIDNPDAQAALMDFLKTRYLEGGAGLFGTGDPQTIAEMKNLLAQKMTDLEGYQINRIVDTGVERIRNWAHVSQLQDAGIPEIEIVEPTQECPFCAQMNGQIIRVDAAYKSMTDQANMPPEEYQTFLEENQAILENIQDYVDQGLLPPYHPHCRGRIIKRMA